MAEQRSLGNPEAAVAQPPPRNANLTRIQIVWNEGAVKTIEIRHRRDESARAEVFGIDLKPGCRPGHQKPLGSAAQVRVVLERIRREQADDPWGYRWVKPSPLESD